MSQSDFFRRHEATLRQALAAIRTRDYWSPYAENPSPKAYGEDADAQGQAAFKSHLNKDFALAQPGLSGTVGDEASPYGIELNITYPQVDIDVLLPAMKAALPAWRDAGVEVRTGVCLEILQRLNQRSFEIAYAVMHTTGQGFIMAFQAGGPHAQERGLEAIAYAYKAMSHVPPRATWSKPQGKHEPLLLEKTFHLVPRGLGLVIGCSTFPTWNSYPGLFASLVTGNPVLVKPHHGAVLPLAITVHTAQEVLKEAGFAPHLVALAANAADEPLAKRLAQHPEVRIIDYTGGAEFGTWLEQNAGQAQVYTEKSGVNAVVIDSVDDFKAMARNLAFTLSLYSGQMCTTPQALFVPRDGIQTGTGHMSFDEVAQGLAGAVSKFLADPERAAMVLGAIQSKATLERLQQAPALAEVVLASERKLHPLFPDARVHSPLIMKVEAAQEDIYMQERFGPISFLVATDSTEHSIELAQQVAQARGAITWGVYSTDDAILARMEAAAMTAGVALSSNLTDGVFVNQSAAFSDFHATGANPAANACLTDLAFVASRFRVVQSRRHPA